MSQFTGHANIAHDLPPRRTDSRFEKLQGKPARSSAHAECRVLRRDERAKVVATLAADAMRRRLGQRRTIALPAQMQLHDVL